MATRALNRYVTCIALLFLIFALPAGMIAAEKPQSYRFFYYHPDSVQNNLSQLKVDMDRFLAGVGFTVRFQPFNHLADFNNLLRTENPAFLWIPEWYMTKHGKDLGLKPFLIATFDGKSTYRKVLVCSTQKRLSMADLSGKTMAMTAMGPDRRQILDTILFTEPEISTDQLSIIDVPKDSDALLAVILGQMDLALVSEENLRHLSMFNTIIERNIIQLRQTAPIPRPYLCYREGSVREEDIDIMRQLFLQTSSQQGKKTIKEALQIDAWQPISD